MMKAARYHTPGVPVLPPELLKSLRNEIAARARVESDFQRLRQDAHAASLVPLLAGIAVRAAAERWGGAVADKISAALLRPDLSEALLFPMAWQFAPWPPPPD
jgi:hypothetical protein